MAGPEGAPQFDWNLGYGPNSASNIMPKAQSKADYNFTHIVPPLTQQTQAAQNFNQMGIPGQIAYIPQVDTQYKVPQGALGAYWPFSNTTNMQNAPMRSNAVDTHVFEHEAMHGFENYLTPAELSRWSTIYTAYPPNYTQHPGSPTGYVDSNAWNIVNPDRSPGKWPAEAIRFMQQYGPKALQRAQMTQQIQSVYPGTVVLEDLGMGNFLVRTPSGEYITVNFSLGESP